MRLIVETLALFRPVPERSAFKAVLASCGKFRFSFGDKKKRGEGGEPRSLRKDRKRERERRRGEGGKKNRRLKNV